METLDYQKQYENIKKSALEATQGMFPIEGKDKLLRATKIWVDDDLDPTDYADQKDAKLKDKTWGAPVRADFELVDKATGKVVEKEKGIRLFMLPKATTRMSFIVGGNEYQVDNQLRRKPGIYTIRSQGGDGDLRTEFNVAGGQKLDLVANQKTGVIRMKSRQGEGVPIYPILSHLGISDAAMAKAWGEDIFASNKSFRSDKAEHYVRQAAKNLSKNGLLPTTATEATDIIRKRLGEMEVDPVVNEKTIGDKSPRIEPHTLLAAAKNLIDVQFHPESGKKPIERDSLQYKQLLSVEDFIKERLQKKLPEAKRKFANKLNIRKDQKIRDIVDLSVLNPTVESFFTQTDLSHSSEQTNPLQIINSITRVTMQGEGGAKASFTITPEARALHPTHLGFIDPVHSPESDQIGSTLHLSLGARKRGKDITTPVIDVKTGKHVEVTPQEMNDSVVSFPDQYNAKTGKFDSQEVKVLRNGQHSLASPSEVKYVLADPKQAFSISTNLVPFLHSNSGGRALMASKMLEQAIPLVEREAPIVQTKIRGTTFEKVIGHGFSHHSPVDGKVKSVGKSIVIVDSQGKTHEVNLYDNFPLNGKAFLHSEPSVKAGDVVTAGQNIGDTNYTKDGTLAIGTNLKTVYTPYLGKNFEDGVAISESAAKKLSSEHMYPKYFRRQENVFFDRDRFAALFPTAFSREQLLQLDDDGVIHKGSIVNPGDPLLAAVRHVQVNQADIARGKASAKALRPERSAEETWKGITAAKVVDVVKGSEGVKVFLRTVEPAQVGDKITGRYGNKGVIVSVIPDDQVPRIGGEHGEPADVILNPTGIITRMNIGQMLETSASKIAAKTGKTYEVDNFGKGDATKMMRAELDKHGLSDTDELYDPATNKNVGRVLSGKQYMLKLSKQAGTMFSARSWGEHTSGYDINKAPIHGGEEGSKALDLLTLYAMLAHGSRANLKEMAVYKSQQNDEFWRAYEHGQQLPPPKPTFAYEKFMSYLKGAGVNVEANGSKQILVPMTDKEVEHLSSGAVTEPLFVRRKDLAPEAGGFFDPATTGGLPDRSGEGGEKWSHIELAEPVPNPIMESPIRALLGLDKAKFNGLVQGKTHYDPKTKSLNTDGTDLTGGRAIKEMLAGLDVDAMLKDATATSKTTKSQAKLDEAHKIIRYLRAVKESGRKPDELYIQSKIPVIPPIFRPMYALPSGDLTVEGPNRLYQHVSMLSKELAWQNSVPYITDKVKADLRSDLYKSVGALAGMTQPLGFFPDKRKPSGFIELVKGKGQSKEGYFQREVLRRKQDLVGRGTIIPDPKLGSDEVSLPQDMAWAIFKPFVVRNLVSSRGYTPADATKAWEDRSPVATSVIQQVMAERPVMLNRAPSLHKFSIMAFKPQMHDDPKTKSIKIPPLIVKGFNADFDGDQVFNSVILSIPGSIRGIRPEDIRTGELMAARFNVTTAAKQGNVTILAHLEDFPHGTLIKSKEGKNGRIDYYEALPGTEVLALNEGTGRVEWASVSGWSRHHDRTVEIVELQSGRELYTDDDPRAVYGIDPYTLEYTRDTPTNAINRGLFVPRAPRIDLPGELTEISTQQVVHTLPAINEQIVLTERFGYLIGAAAGNGCMGPYFGMTGLCAEVQARVADVINDIMKDEPEQHTYTRTEDGSGHGPNRKTVYSSQALGHALTGWVGHGARNKRLPTFAFVAPREFLFGLFAGLMDTDGSISVSNAKAKPQLMASYSSASLRLAQGVRLIASMLGMSARVTPTKTPAGKDFWVVGFSAPDIQEWNGRGMAHPDKLAKLRSVVPISRDSGSACKDDIVPMSPSLANHLSKIIKATVDRSLYTILRKTNREPWIGRRSAERIIAMAGNDIIRHPLGQRWLNIVCTAVTWDRVIEVRRGGIQTGYDLTVPGYETFMDVDGVILSNTMTVHVPVLDAAVEEAKRMFPSKNIYNPGTGSLMLEPRQESMIGLNILSQDPVDKKPKANLKSYDEVEAGINRGALKYNDVIELNGETTTAGRALINQHLPSTVGRLTKELNKTNASNLYKEIAAKEKDNYANIIDRLRQLGDTHAFRSGFTVSLADAQPDIPGKDQIFREAHVEAAALRKGTGTQESKDAATRKVFEGAEKKVRGIVESTLKSQGNRFYTMVSTGARGNMTQLKQIVSAPVLVRDHRGDTISTPVTSSFSSGMPLSDYWVTLYGARAGAMDRQLQTSKPGAFTKDIMAATVSNLISKDDCGDDRGLPFDIKDPKNLREVNDRFLAADVIKDGKTYAKRNDLITPKLTAELLQHGVHTINARSPLTCLSPHGICAMDYGLHDDGTKPQVGDNIGAISGQAMSEPLTQLTMSTFHSGSVAGAGLKLSTFDKIDRLMSLRKRLPGKATLADVTGRIDKIEPSLTKGGFNITIGGIEHFVPKSLPLLVHEGSKVKAGDTLSEGLISPQELLDRKKELLPALEYMAKEVTNAYQSEGVPLRQRAVETVVRTIGSLTKVVDPGDSNYAPGELAPYQVVQKFNRTALGTKPIGESEGHVLAADYGPIKGGTTITAHIRKLLGELGHGRVKVGPSPIIHEPQLYGIKRLPLMREDWMSQLGYNHIKDALLEGAANRSVSDIHGYSPIPAFAYAAEFGEGEDGKY